MTSYVVGSVLTHIVGVCIPPVGHCWNFALRKQKASVLLKAWTERWGAIEDRKAVLLPSFCYISPFHFCCPTLPSSCASPPFPRVTIFSSTLVSLQHLLKSLERVITSETQDICHSPLSFLSCFLSLTLLFLFLTFFCSGNG